jgi:hypothetical protein
VRYLDLNLSGARRYGRAIADANGFMTFVKRCSHRPVLIGLTILADSLDDCQLSQGSCRSKVVMSYLGKVEMSY